MCAEIDHDLALAEEQFEDMVEPCTLEAAHQLQHVAVNVLPGRGDELEYQECGLVIGCGFRDGKLAGLASYRAERGVKSCPGGRNLDIPAPRAAK